MILFLIKLLKKQKLDKEEYEYHHDNEVLILDDHLLEVLIDKKNPKWRELQFEVIKIHNLYLIHNNSLFQVLLEFYKLLKVGGKSTQNELIGSSLLRLVLYNENVIRLHENKKSKNQENFGL